MAIPCHLFFRYTLEQGAGLGDSSEILPDQYLNWLSVAVTYKLRSGMAGRSG